jgi:hypothetical protein
MEMTFDDLSDLAFKSARGARGPKAKQPLFVSFSRELNLADLDALNNPSPLGSETPVIKRLRSQHHTLARLLSGGMKAVEASLVTGYSQSRISLLQKDPAFQELMSYYKGQAEECFVDVHKRLGDLGTAVVEELQERLEEDPEGFSHKELLAVAELALDRSVAPPKTRVGQVGGQLPSIAISFHGGAAAPSGLPPSPKELIYDHTS